jgi:hypothetical protein
MVAALKGYDYPGALVFIILTTISGTLPFSTFSGEGVLYPVRLSPKIFSVTPVRLLGKVLLGINTKRFGHLLSSCQKNEVRQAK